MRFLFVDRIIDLSPGEYVRGVKHVTRDDFYLCSDQQGRLCFIPSLIGEALGQLAAWNIMQSNGFTLRPVAGLAASAKLHRPAYVGETLLLESYIDRLDDAAVQYHSIAHVGDEVVFTLDGALGPLLPMDDFINPQMVRQQFNEINLPGTWPIPASAPSLEVLSADSIVPRVAPMLFDRLLSCEPGVRMSAEKRITRAAPYFPDHFPRKPVLPLTVLLESKLNLAHEFVKRSSFDKPYKVCEMRKVKMVGFVQPGDTLISAITVKRHTTEELILTFRSEVEGRRVCMLDVVLV